MDLNLNPIENPEETSPRRPTRKRSGPGEFDPEENIERELRPSILLSQSSPPRKQPRRSVRRDQVSSPTTEPTVVTRQRGRPRLESQDQSASERRRTQIRLAQRAYRQRKETTITELNQRVSHLETVVEEMNGAFSAFDDKMTSSGIPARNPAFARELSKARERFLDLTRSIAVDAGSEQEEEEPSSGTTSARSYRPPETQHFGASSRLTVPQIPLQSSSQVAPDPLEQFPPFDLSQMPFYDYPTRVPEDTTSPQQPIFQGLTQNPFGEEVEDPTTQDWDPDKPVQQYRVEVPEVCPELYEGLFESSHPVGGNAREGDFMTSLEGRRRFLCHLTSSNDPKEVEQLVEVLRRITCSPKCAYEREGKDSIAARFSESIRSGELNAVPPPSAELSAEVTQTYDCSANAEAMEGMTRDFNFGNQCPSSPVSPQSSTTQHGDHDAVQYPLAERRSENHREFFRWPQQAGSDSTSTLSSSPGYAHSHGRSGSNTCLWLNDRSSGSPLSPATPFGSAGYHANYGSQERAPFHGYDGSFPLP